MTEKTTAIDWKQMFELMVNDECQPGVGESCRGGDCEGCWPIWWEENKGEVCQGKNHYAPYAGNQ